MEIVYQYHHFAATLLARVLLGILFIYQGYDAVFRIKIRNVADTYDDLFEQRGIPKFLTKAGAWYTSLTELICGFLLIVGLFSHIALYLLGINILLASFAFGLNTPLWDTKHVWPRFVLIIFLLVVPVSWNALSLDHLIFNLK
jgi:putative oxidoreductase